jgi:ABC-2 type transport system permease protein
MTAYGPRSKRAGIAALPDQGLHRALLRLGTMTALELRLFLREPLTVVFTLALPLVMLFVLGGVFGNTPDADADTGQVVFRGVGPTDYYVPAYIGLVLGSLGLVSLPAHLAAYRERGVLRRFYASSVPLWAVFGAQLAVTLLVGLVSGLLLAAVSYLAYRISAPAWLGGVALAYLLGGVAATSLGILLGSVMPTARAAQGVGVLVWWVTLILGGAGPPPEVLPDYLQTAAGLLPLRHVILLLQDPWLEGAWSWPATAWVVVTLVTATALAARFFRWE